jgi:hypothetical protein
VKSTFGLPRPTISESPSFEAWQCKQLVVTTSTPLGRFAKLT